MAIKDWKKIRDGWRGKSERIILNEYFKVPKYEITIRYNWQSGAHTIKTFKTKSQALAYAKAYMRKH